MTTCPNSPLMAPQNFKVTMETDELQRRITELCDINADLQVPVLSVSYYFFIFSSALLHSTSVIRCFSLSLSLSAVVLFNFSGPEMFLTVYPSSKDDLCIVSLSQKQLCQRCCHHAVPSLYSYVTAFCMSTGADSLF